MTDLTKKEARKPLKPGFYRDSNGNYYVTQDWFDRENRAMKRRLWFAGIMMVTMGTLSYLFGLWLKHAGGKT